VDYPTRLALVAEEQDAGGPPLHAVARYEPGEADGTTEVAIVVEDAWQHRGLGTLLLDALLAAAEARGLRRFTADVLADNRPMLRILSRLAHIQRRDLEAGVLTIEFERRQFPQDRLA
jgi:acetyltransferase